MRTGYVVLLSNCDGDSIRPLDILPSYSMLENFPYAYGFYIFIWLSSCTLKFIGKCQIYEYITGNSDCIACITG